MKHLIHGKDMAFFLLESAESAIADAPVRQIDIPVDHIADSVTYGIIAYIVCKAEEVKWVGSQQPEGVLISHFPATGSLDNVIRKQSIPQAVFILTFPELTESNTLV
jgi:hypothetical protein